MGNLQSISMAKLERESVGAMRVVVLDPDPEIRKILHETIGEWPELLLVDESRTSKECKALLDIPSGVVDRAYRDGNSQYLSDY